MGDPYGYLPDVGGLDGAFAGMIELRSEAIDLAEQRLAELRHLLEVDGWWDVSVHTGSVWSATRSCALSEPDVLVIVGHERSLGMMHAHRLRRLRARLAGVVVFEN